MYLTRPTPNGHETVYAYSQTVPLDREKLRRECGFGITPEESRAEYERKQKERENDGC